MDQTSQNDWPERSWRWIDSTRLAGRRWSAGPGGDQIRFEMWFAADSIPGAMRGARLALKQALVSAGIGDPNPPTGITHADVRLVLEEWPTVDRLA